MKRALSLVASFFSSCTGGHRPPSMPAADRPYPDTSGAEPLPPSRVHIGIASRDDRTLRLTVSGNSDDLDHATTVPRTVPRRMQAVGTPVAHGHVDRIRRNARGPHTHHRILALSFEAVCQRAMMHADVAQGQVEVLVAAPSLAQRPGMPGDHSLAPWHTTPLFRPPGLPPCAVPAGAYQDQGHTLHVQDAQDKQIRMSGVVEAVLLRTYVILGVQRQMTADPTEDVPRLSHRGCQDWSVWLTTNRP